MWQRIQTLYLALAAGLTAALFFSVKAFMLGPGGVRAQEWTYVQFYPYLVLLIVVTLLGSSKFRVLQMRTAVLAALLLLALQAWIAVDYFTAEDALVFRYTAVFPLAAFILDVLAARAIFRDQLLVESASRLRSMKKNGKLR